MALTVPPVRRKQKGEDVRVNTKSVEPDRVRKNTNNPFITTKYTIIPKAPSV